MKPLPPVTSSRSNRGATTPDSPDATQGSIAAAGRAALAGLVSGVDVRTSAPGPNESPATDSIRFLLCLRRSGARPGPPQESVRISARRRAALRPPVAQSILAPVA